MKRTVFFTLGLLVFAYCSNAQPSVTEQVAQHLAIKLKDSLDLSVAQKDSLLTINLLLANQKSQWRSVYQHTDSLQFYIQRVERTRDSLYRPVLGEEKYFLYKEKKKTLLSVN